MADLIQIRVEDFRAYRRAQIDLQATGLILIAGPNNSGKSALLSAFDVIAGRPKPPGVCHIAGRSARVWARFRLSDEERFDLLGGAPESSMEMQTTACEWIEWEFADTGERMQAVSVKTSWRGEDLVIGLLERDQNDTQWHLRTSNAPLSVWDGVLATQSSGSPFWPNALEEFVSFSSIGPLAKKILPKWREGYFHLDSVRRTEAGPQHANANPVLNPNGSNLTDVLHDMRSNREDAWQALREHISNLVPGVGKLKLAATSTMLDIVFEQSLGTEVISQQLKSLGSGVEQLLMGLVAGLTQSATTVILEEPEATLHPAAQRAFLVLLQEWSQKRLIIASTHSAAMLDWSSDRATIISTSRKGMESAVTRMPARRSAALDVLHELGVRASDILIADRILVLEGTTEMEIFNHWFPEHMMSPRLAVLSGTGGYNANHADLFASWLNDIDQLDTRKVLYVRDQDELSSTFLAKLQASSRVEVLPCREFENLLLNYEALAAVINSDSRTGVRQVTAAEVGAKAREIAARLVNVVVLKRTMAEFADPLRYVDHNLRRRFGKSDVDLEDLAQAIADRLPDKNDLKASIIAVGERHVQEVEATWEDEWSKVAPGDELLSGIFMAYLDRRYRKLEDGPAIAKAMSRPKYLEDLLDKFMADD